MKIAHLIFELGSIQVFNYRTIEESLMPTDSYTEVYWQDKISKHTYGPFLSIYDFMTHYTTVIASQKISIIGEQLAAPIIYVDFKNKRRIIYG